MIVVVGSLNMDLVVRSPRLPKPGETLSGGPFATYPGGKGANQAVAAARLGAPTAMVGRVGSDGFGQMLRIAAEVDGVNIARVIDTPGLSTGVALITVEDGGQNTIVIAHGANAALTPEDVEAAAPLITSARVLLLQLEVPLPVVTRAAAIARAAGAIVILNPAPAPVTRLPAELLANVDYLVPNESEAAAFLDEPSGAPPKILARALSAVTGVPNAIITLGEFGAVLSGVDGSAYHPAFRVSAVDSTAAGVVAAPPR
ncbi:ribokinase [Oscillochloris sp. ZM17-4]|uniref:ribokinase n=1 Tax=Oscillochloris sp. ZM17-4 TaxID=2866714 RepID=UPI0021028BB1|nr:ribokinase [Oscillochloris sp. ZM17-4]